MDQELWKLKILTGAYLGVIIDLPEGSFTLGTNDATSDVILPGYNLSEAHLRFEVNKDHELYAILLNKEDGLRINSNIAEEDRSLVENSSILTTKGLSLAVVFGATDWPEFQEIKETIDKDNLSIENEQSEEESQEDTKAKKSRIIINPLVKSFLFASFALLCVIFPVSVVLIFSLITEDNNMPSSIIIDDKSSSIELDIKSIRRKIEIAGLYGVNVSLLFSKTEVILVSGYVRTKKDFDELKVILKSIKTISVLKVKVEETIVQTVNSLLDRYGFKGLDAYPGEELGTVVLRGYIKDYSKFSELENYLNTKVLGLKSWDLEYIHSVKLLVIFKRMLTLAGVIDIKHIEMDGKKLVVFADLSDSQNKIFHQQAEYFRRRYGFSPSLEAYTKSLSEQSLKIASVEIGRNPRFTLKNGESYMRGSALPSGFIVKEINRKGITMIKGNQAMFYSFGVTNNE
jgi:type III secretion system YscD/HrpQ family protein